MTTTIECPICLDAIDLTTVSNRVTTECGHTFHCNCLMQSCAHNGFGCPYCRTAMATLPDEEEEEDEDEEEEEEEEEDAFTDDALQGFRYFFNNVNNEEHDEEDILEEEIVYPKPPTAYIAETLIAQGVTMEQLVKIMLLDHEEYEDEEEEFDQIEDSVWDRLRIIISNYQPQQLVANHPEEPLTQQPEEPLTQQPEPKTQVIIRRRETMFHV
jgi:hypothetical protein